MRTIGASFSGGGFRASAFTFGCLSYLDRASFNGRTLLNNVAYSSSTSGGSIAMALHALRSYQGVAMSRILLEARGKMQGDTLLAEAMRILQDPAAWTAYPTKTRNLINAFSIAYHERFYDRSGTGFLQNRSQDPPIQRYCFNTTEMTHGISFRFDLSGEPQWIGDVGNGWQRFATGKQAVLDQVRLADVAACSSCFPVGFEPVLFPDDLEQSPPIGLKDALVDNTGTPLQPSDLPFGIIDGGAVDNQGLYSLGIEAQRRVRRGLPAFGLVLICDVTSFYMDAYRAPSTSGTWGRGLRVKWLVALTLLCVLGLLGGAVLALVRHQFIIAALLAPLLIAVGMVCTKLVGLVGGSGDGSWGVMLKRFGWPLLRNLSLRTLRALAIPRFRVLGLLLNNVFMNQIRRQGYAVTYEEERKGPDTITCLIYELATKNIANLDRGMAAKRKVAAERHHEQLWDAAVRPLKTITAPMRRVADSAAGMPTTLWFDSANKHRLDDILACGQFTLCFNLLVYLAEVEAWNGKLDEHEQRLRAQLLADWELFTADPMYLLNQIIATT